MIYASVLAAHVVVACITGLVASYALVILWQRSERWYRAISVTLATLATFEVLSGTVLSITSPTITAASLCANIALYISAICAVEILLFLRMNDVSVRFPVTRVTLPLASSVLVLMGAVVYGA